MAPEPQGSTSVLAAPGPAAPAERPVSTRNWPDRVIVRIALALAAVMVLAQAIGFVFFLSGRELLPRRGEIRAIEAQLRAPAEALLATPIAERVAVAAQASTSSLTIRAEPTFQPHGLVVDMPWLFPLRDRMLVDLGGTIDQFVAEAPLRPQDLGPPLPWHRPDPALPLTLWLRLGDGSWMTATLPAGQLIGPGPLRLLIPWIGAALSILVTSLLLARHVTGLLRNFAAAADRVGRDLGATPLTEAGPAEVRSVVRAFNQMQARLKRFVADRTQMLAAISHDLMTPISRLRLRTEALRPSVERGRMLSDLALMERIVSATLDFAREDVTAERRQRLDLGSLVQAVCDEFADGGGAVTYEGPDYVEITAAPTALARAVRNVVENAIKYAGGCAVRLTIANAVAQIVVADGGPGIPTTELEQVFEPFYRLDRARTGEQGGSGLGLAIARGVLRAHGGDVTLENNTAGVNNGAGLRATLSLPLSQAT